MPQITNLLLALPRLGNTYLSQSSYSILAHVFDSPMEDDSADLSNQLPDVLKVILTSPPSKSDFALVSSWVLVLGRALSALQSLLPSVASAELHKVWKGVWNFLDSNDQETRRAVATSLSVITSCFSPSLIKAAVSDSGKNSVIRKIIDQVTHALDALQYAKSIPEVLAIAAATMTNLQYRETSSSPTAAEQLAMPLVIKICDLRISISFDHKEAADVFLGTSMRVLGPEVMLKALPLNLEEQKRYGIFFDAGKCTQPLTVVPEKSHGHSCFHSWASHTHPRYPTSSAISSLSAKGCSIISRRQKRKVDRQKPRSGQFWSTRFGVDSLDTVSERRT